MPEAGGRKKGEALTYFLEGKRIYLREVRPSDVNERYYRWMNDPEITRFLESRFAPNAIENLRDYVAGKLGDRDNLFLAIVLKEEDRHIGNIKLGPIQWIHRLADIGLLIGEKDCWGKGYATEAIQLVSDYAFNVLNLHKVAAGCYGPNEGSARAFQKAGFVVEGVRKEQFYSNGSYVDDILLGLIRPDWNQGKRATG
ncbi:GNAT family N-acetyltransferase [Candidatus Manganitrophus noduliformans]|uniref:GNAT family N-acetyltransferase n=1 Tax=Candidatus Manganitrophus noduliformans TaxID=2606439 RepID=UPI00192DE723|nr:GNAT family protein [Candidatus Manganitrophus noduliformans]